MSPSAEAERPWNSDRLAVLLFLLATGLAVGFGFGSPAGSVLIGIGTGLVAIVLAAFVVWALLRSPLARIADAAMRWISGR